MKKRIDNNNIIDKLDFSLNSGAVSHNETTGLIPFLAENDYEIKSYKEIDQYEQPPISHKKQDNSL